MKQKNVTNKKRASRKDTSTKLLFYAIPLFIAAMIFSQWSMTTTTTSQAAAETSCNDGKTAKVGGNVWQRVERNKSTGDQNVRASVGLRDISLTITRGDGVRALIRSGYEYRYNESTRTVIKVRALATEPWNLGHYFICGFIYDRNVYGTNNKTLFSVEGDSLVTIRPPAYRLPYDGSTILYTQDVNGVNTKEYTARYANQIGGGGYENAPVGSCNSRARIDPSTSQRPMHRCDFLQARIGYLHQ